MDFDIEMEDATAGQYPVDVSEDILPQDDILPIDANNAQEPGEIDEAVEGPKEADVTDSTLVPNKVHLRGLDALNPDDIKAYVAEHTSSSGGGPFDRIEWIDDSSANLVFSSEAAAAAALSALSAIPIDDPFQLPVREPLPAKPFSAKPDDVSAGLQVRFAIASDKKQAGAAARSRFYLLHPEYDPEERRRTYQQNRRRDDRDYRDRNRDRDYRDYRPRHRSYRDGRRGGDDREDDIRNNTFDVNLYDDDAPALAARTTRRRSWSRSRSRSRSRSPARFRYNNRDKELFPAASGKEGKELFPEKVGANQADTENAHDRDRGRDRDRDRDRDWDRGGGLDHGRLRNRSASPRREDAFYFDEGGDYDGRLADERAEAAAAAAARNRDKARAIKDRLEIVKGADSRNGSNSAKELFPGIAGGTAQMDLFDNTSAVTQRLSGMSVSFDGTCEELGLEVAVSTATSATTASGGSKCSGIRNRKEQAITMLARMSARTDNDNVAGSSTFNIRGLAGQQGQQKGLSIKGAASARELFPDKLSGGNDGDSGRGRNAGKEVFDNSLQSRIRPRPRQRAEDLFH